MNQKDQKEIQDYIKSLVSTDKSNKSRAVDDIKLHPFSKTVGGENYHCTNCDLPILSEDKIMASARINSLGKYTAPHPPRFMFHITREGFCAPAYTKSFNVVDSTLETILETKHYSNYSWYVQSKQAIVNDTDIKTAYQWQPVVAKKTPLKKRLSKLA